MSDVGKLLLGLELQLNKSYLTIDLQGLDCRQGWNTRGEIVIGYVSANEKIIFYSTFRLGYEYGIQSCGNGCYYIIIFSSCQHVIYCCLQKR
jgi:hypothetical protein